MSRPSPVRKPDPAADRPRIGLLLAVGAVCLLLGLLVVRCSLDDPPPAAVPTEPG